MASDTPATADTVQPAGRESPAVWCGGLAKRYGRQHAVRSVSFEVARGEVVGLLGPNGAGKTSVIKMMLQLVRPDAGEVMLLGQSSADPAARSRVGYLPELFRFQPWLTADEVLVLHGRLAGVRLSRATRADLLQIVGLAERASDRTGTYSKGMQQRLGLAVALLGEPELVILDEPTSALDPLGRADVRDIVLDLKARGVAVLLNSHLIGEVERVCDRVVILDAGGVAAEGSLDDLLGQQRIHLHLEEVDARAITRLDAAGAVVRDGDHFTITLPSTPHADPDPSVADLVRDLVALGVRVHAVEPTRISLEDRLLGILRARSEGPEAR